MMESNQFSEFVFWAREAGRYGLVKCSSGNLSQRSADQQVLISASGSWLPVIDAAEVAVMDAGGEYAAGQPKPSGEYRLHLGILKARKEVNTVLHFQSPYATALACRKTPPDYNVIIEIPIYIGKIVTLPFIQPGSPELAEAVARAAETAGLIQLSNHGQVVYGRDYKEVIQKAVFFELACSVIVNAGVDVQFLSVEEQLKLSAYLKSR